jgi:uncharacterized protein (TIGR00255 family)
MTGFGSSEKGIFKVEVRSLNHRYLDISVRIPPSLIDQEIAIRNIVKKRLQRGKIDLFISLSNNRKVKIAVNKNLAREIYGAFSELQRELNLPGVLDISFFSVHKDLFLIEEESLDIKEMYEALDEAISNLESMRKKEGEALLEELKKHLKNIDKICTRIQDDTKDRIIKIRDNLLKRTRHLLSDLNLDEVRIAQEALLMAQKADISEEIERLRSHIEQFRLSLNEEGSIGKKLDFIVQEMNREATTIASKIDDLVIANSIVNLKLEIEKIREQVQNIQ